ncbi:hypothetical protein [Streptomyces mangrovisoli]|uniref:Uncharacterized protein n=1 Tax=Streptomyces mangrovisoli TaxID=1428628 RepID=A0A1J4NX13_9ACTN|nr:hypothetical protein WN71_020430 [Streptomyces mangrovisoli]
MITTVTRSASSDVTYTVAPFRSGGSRHRLAAVQGGAGGKGTNVPTGAGDAAVAAPGVGPAANTPWPERIRRAVALPAAAVKAPPAGDFDDCPHPDPLPGRTITPDRRGVRPGP